MSETVHEVRMIELAPGETLEAHGYTPDDVMSARDATYTTDGKRQDLLRLWVIKEKER